MSDCEQDIPPPDQERSEAKLPLIEESESGTEHLHLVRGSEPYARHRASSSSSLSLGSNNSDDTTTGMSKEDGVLVVLPPEGITTPSNPAVVEDSSPEESCESSYSYEYEDDSDSSFEVGDDVTISDENGSASQASLPRDDDEEEEDFSMLGDLSSTVEVQGTMPLTIGEGSETNQQSDSFSFVTDGFSVGSDTYSFPQLSVETASYTYPVDTTDTASISSSVYGNFEVLSLASNEVVKKCRRCHRHNSLDAPVCVACGLALVANPSPDMDEQIAMALQRKEEKDAYASYVAMTDRIFHMKDKSLLEQSQTLADAIHRAMDVFQKAHPSQIKVLSVLDLEFLASKFIEAASAGFKPSIRLAYRFTSSSEDVWNEVRQSGFPPSIAESIGVCVSTSVEAAQHAYDYPYLLRPIFDAVGKTIPDRAMKAKVNPDEACSANQSGWLVCCLEFSESPELRCGIECANGTYEAMFYMEPRKVMPLVRFHGGLKEHQVIDRMRNALSSVCWEFFQNGMQFLVDIPEKIEPMIVHKKSFQGDDTRFDADETSSLKVVPDRAPGHSMINTEDDENEEAKGWVEHMKYVANIKEDFERRIKSKVPVLGTITFKIPDQSCKPWAFGAFRKETKEGIAYDLKEHYVKDISNGIFMTTLGRFAHPIAGGAQDLRSFLSLLPGPSSPLYNDQELQALAESLVHYWTVRRNPPGRFFYQAIRSAEDRYVCWYELNRPHAVQEIRTALLWWKKEQSMPIGKKAGVNPLYSNDTQPLLMLYDTVGGSQFNVDVLDRDVFLSDESCPIDGMGGNEEFMQVVAKCGKSFPTRNYEERVDLALYIKSFCEQSRIFYKRFHERSKELGAECWKQLTVSEAQESIALYLKTLDDVDGRMKIPEADNASEGS